MVWVVVSVVEVVVVKLVEFKVVVIVVGTYKLFPQTSK
jgi:hypothetical protein